MEAYTSHHKKVAEVYYICKNFIVNVTVTVVQGGSVGLNLPELTRTFPVGLLPFL